MTEQHIVPDSEVWAVIINKTAGKKRFHHRWTEMAEHLRQIGLQLVQRETEYAGHAIELAHDFADCGFRNILVVGGDGTLNEVVNGIYKSDAFPKNEISLALLPYGTGNDWGRYWGMRRGKTPIVDIIRRGKRVKVDIGVLRFKVEGVLHEHYFLNGLGLGIDSKVVYYTNILKNIFGGHHWLYSVSLLCSVFTHRSQRVSAVDAKGNKLDTSLFTASVGNGCFSGGGLRQTDGDPTDGEMFTTLVHNPTFSKIITGLGDLFRGNLWENPLCSVLRSDTLRLHTERSLLIETDGVIINVPEMTHKTGSQVTDYEISTVPSALQMVIP